MSVSEGRKDQYPLLAASSDEQISGGTESVTSPDELLASGGVSRIIRELSDRQLSPKVGRALRMLNSLDAYISHREFGMSGSLLYEHQRDVFHSIHSFLVDACTNPDNTGLGHIKLPTGTGKTAIFATFVDVLNKHASPRPDGESDKALVLVPWLDLIPQTRGDKDDSSARGFAGFAPDLSVSEYHGTRKDLEGDVVVMTYYSFANAVHAGKLPKDLFNLVVCDEAHKALGPYTASAVAEYTEDKIAIGLTATPEYAEDKNLANVFPYKIHDMGLREAVELGFLAPIQCLAITSDEEIETINKYSRDFSDTELEPLITHEWRNAKAVEFAKSLIEQGKQGLVSCVPGQELAHAHLVAELLSSGLVVDPATGEVRHVRAVAVGGNIPPKERPEIYKRYEAGEIDVLCYVDLLSEGWDSTAAKFLINLRPTTSPVLAEQRLGRILRPTHEDDVAVVVEFIDKSDRPQYTFYQAFGEDEINPRKVYGRSSSRGSGEPYESVIFDSLPEDTKELLRQIQYRVIGELVIQKVPEAPEGYMSLSQFARAIKSGVPFVSKFIAENDIPLEVHRYLSVVAPGLSPESQARILALPEFQIPEAPEGYKTIAQLVREWNTSGPNLTSFIEDMGLTVEIHKYGEKRAKPYPGLSPESQAAIMSSPDFLLPIPEDYTSVPTLVRELGVSKKTLEQLIQKYEIPTTRYRSHTHPADSLSPEARDQLIALDELQARIAEKPPEGYVSVRQFSKSQGVSIDKIKNLIEKYGIQVESFKHGTKAAASLSPEAQASLASSPELTIEIEPAPDGYISLRRFADSIHSNYSTVEKAAEAQGIELEVHKYGSNISKSLSPEVQAQLRELPELQDAGEAPDGYKSVSQIARELEMQPQTILKVIEDNDIPTSVHRYGRGVPARDVSPEDAERLMALPELVIRRAPEGYLSVRGLAEALGVKQRVIRKAVGEIGLKETVHRFRSQVGQSFSPEAQDEVRRFLEQNKE